MHFLRRTFATAALLFPVLACSTAQGDLTFSTWGEEYIEKGIPSSEFADGWGVTFDTFLVVLADVEVSDGTIDMARERKLELIALFARDFKVLSEVGSKDAEQIYAPYQWVEWIKEEQAAGAWKVITEARESGTAGIFRTSGEVRSGLIDEIAHEIDVAGLLFEAPQKAQQAWFIKHFGPDVNLGNIPPDEVIPLETLRRGLRSDTMAQIFDLEG